jgi:competence protein ComEC
VRRGSPVWWNAYPALLGAVAVGGGVAGGAAFSFGAWTALAGALLAGAGALLLGKQVRLVSLRPLGWTVLALAALAALGAARYQQGRALPPSHVAHLTAGPPDSLDGEGHAVVLEGRVRSAPERSRRATRLVLSARRLLAPADTARTGTARVDTIPATGKVAITLRPSAWDAPRAPFPPVAEGDRLRLRGRLRAPPRPRNPADFDYGAYLRRQGIYATMTLYEPSRVTVTGRQRTLLEQAVVPARHYVARQLARFVPGRSSAKKTGSEARGVLRALLLGDRSLLAEATEEKFARSGLMHLLAVSGLHVLLVGWLFFQGVRPSLLRMGLHWRPAEFTRAALTLGVLGFYVLLAGAPASATRATVMAALLMGATLAQRPTRSLNALGAAAVLLLLWRPAQLFEAGFQLSFAAVGAIVTLVPWMQRRLPRSWDERPLRRWVAQSTLTTLAATLGTMPVLLAHFGRAPFSGLVLNLWAIPLTGVLLMGGLAVVAFGGWFAAGAASAGTAAAVAAEGLFWTARAGDASAPWTLLRVAEAGPWMLAASAAAVLVLVAWPRPRWRWRMAALALALAAAGTWQGVLAGRHAPRLDVLFFDVGHGDAVLLSLPGGGHALIDAGGRSPAGSAAQHTILPHLEARGIERLRTVVLSHPDGDHLGGLPALLRSGVEVGRLVTGGDQSKTALYGETQRLLDSLRVPVRVARAGDTLHLGAVGEARDGVGVAARVFSPTQRLTQGASENDASLALQLAYGRARFLFTGDAEAAMETLLVARYGPLLESDAVKIGHHGSATSSVPAFVRAAAGPDAFAVASSGDRFGLPSESVLARWRAAGATPLATARTGAVWLRTDGEHVWRVHWRE